MTGYDQNAGTEPAQDGPAGLRQHAEDLELQNKDKDETIAQLRGQVMGTHLEKIGLLPSEGLGKAIIQTYEGEITEEAIASHAQEEYSYSQSAPAAPAPTEEDPAPTQTQTAEDLAAQQAAAQSLAGVSSPIVPTPNAAPTDQDYDTALAAEDATSEVASASIQHKLNRLRSGVESGNIPVINE